MNEINTSWLAMSISKYYFHTRLFSFMTYTYEPWHEICLKSEDLRIICNL